MTEVEDTQSVLQSILIELRDIKTQMAQQDGEHPSRRRNAPRSSAVSLAAEQVGRILSNMNCWDVNVSNRKQIKTFKKVRRSSHVSRLSLWIFEMEQSCKRL